MFRDLKNLRQLSLDFRGENQTFEFPTQIFNGLTSLRSLYIYGSLATKLPDGFLNGMVHLRHLGISANPLLTELPETLFADLSSLTELTLSGNGIKRLPATLFTGLKSIDEITAINNKVEKLPVGLFNGLTNLTKINLMDNQIAGSIPYGIFSNLPKLDQIELSTNRITALEADAFVGLPQLRYVRFAGNDIAFIGDGVFRESPELFSLSLRDNRIETISPEVFHRRNFSSKADLCIEGNPLMQETKSQLNLQLGERVAYESCY
jgi:Leucine-rich repeat (LRR) protein